MIDSPCEPLRRSVARASRRRGAFATFRAHVARQPGDWKKRREAQRTRYTSQRTYVPMSTLAMYLGRALNVLPSHRADPAHLQRIARGIEWKQEEEANIHLLA